MSKKDTKKAPANKDDSMVEVTVVNNFRDKTNANKFMAVGTEYKTDKKRAAELVKLGYVKYVDEDSDVDDDVDTNVDENSDVNTNVDDTNVDDTNADDEDTSEGNEDNSNTDEDPDANADVDPNADDSNVPNE